MSADVLIREALERAVDYDDWFIREVEKGLAQIDAGQRRMGTGEARRVAGLILTRCAPFVLSHRDLEIEVGVSQGGQ